MRVLIVDDHAPSAEYLRQGLSRSGFNVDVACNGRDALGLVLRQEYCLVVLEFEIAGMGGRALLASLREQVGTPVMVVTRSHSLEDQVFCLKNGADDYLVKPVRLPEFLARAGLRMRSTRPPGAGGPRLTLGDLVLDLSRTRAERAGLRLDLTRQEFMLLMVMLQRQGDVVPRADLVEQIWQVPFDKPTNVVDVAVRRLRSKLDDPFSTKLLHTVRGLGYVLELR
ncbi:Probable transcriptional regulatory protein YedW [Delftia tsuruhatensis]|uniref:winged helix-turn-helix domain-containing protein n=1 Tax=Delftia tsuruhatensis TaxID=180282 RepID=UPI001E7B2C26|nr:winged helix-turn-helix domain-containing protein [Delftia tsuruhatensis]CAB5720610.1 Probable transcriptional regulatory protein YedW [Delftia tsuruhatensis]CAC9693664.1 Probable transcriptional regulatory protein YedW [Delftia tsuruhatensis]